MLAMDKNNQERRTNVWTKENLEVVISHPLNDLILPTQHLNRVPCVPVVTGAFLEDKLKW